MLNVFKFKLDLKRQQSVLINRTVNGDTAVQFQITVTDGGTPVTLDANLNKVLAIFRRSDKQVYVQDAETGLSFSGSVVTINVRPASFRAGRNSVELQIYTRPDSASTTWPDLVTTEQGLFNVRANTLTGDGPNAPSQLPMLEQLIADAGTAVDNCNTATTAANTAAGSANAAATSANAAATAAAACTVNGLHIIHTGNGQTAGGQAGSVYDTAFEVTWTGDEEAAIKTSFDYGAVFAYLYDFDDIWTSVLFMETHRHTETIGGMSYTIVHMSVLNQYYGLIGFAHLNIPATPGEGHHITIKGECGGT